MSEFQDICPQCGSSIPEGTDRCPGCQVQLVFCFSGNCGKAYPSQMLACPFCGTLNEMRELFEQPPAPALPSPMGDPTLVDAAIPPRPAAAQDLGAKEPARGFGAPAVTAPVSPPASPSPPVPGFPGNPAAVFTPPRMDMAALLGGMPGLPGIGALSPIAGMAIGPLTLEVDTSQTPRRSQQSLLTFRATAAEDCRLELTAQSGFWTVPQRREALLIANEPYEFPAMKFIPRVAGTEQVQAAIAQHSAANVPLGRWHTSHQIAIEDVQRDAGGSIQAEVVILGGTGVPGMPGFPQMPSMPAMPGLGGGWKPLVLRPDPRFQSRMAVACPDNSAGLPTMPGAPLEIAPGAAFNAVVYMREEVSGQVRTLACVCGNEASLGRGGDASVAWWIEPEPFDAQQHRRLSRQHAVLTLQSGRAWVSDRSTNGTSLNDNPLSKERPEMLAHGDRIDPAGVVGLRVELQASLGEVHAIRLERGDALKTRLWHLLTTGQRPIQAATSSEGALWIAWHASPGQPAQLAVSAGTSSAWQNLAVGCEEAVAGWQVQWRPLSEPCSQEEYLRHPWAL